MAGQSGLLQPGPWWGSWDLLKDQLAHVVQMFLCGSQRTSTAGSFGWAQAELPKSVHQFLALLGTERESDRRSLALLCCCFLCKDYRLSNIKPAVPLLRIHKLNPVRPWVALDPKLCLV